MARGVRVLDGLVYMQGIQTRTANNANNGRGAIGVPRWQANLGADRDTPFVPDLTLSARMIAASTQYIRSDNSLETSAACWSTSARRTSACARIRCRGGRRSSSPVTRSQD